MRSDRNFNREIYLLAFGPEHFGSLRWVELITSSAWGDSLIASVIAARVYTETGAQLDLGSFVQHSTITSMAGAIERLRTGMPDQLQILRVAGEQDRQLSFGQQRSGHIRKQRQALRPTSNSHVTASLAT